MNSYTLGLDIGSNSIGWALLKKEGKPSIKDIGVRVFPEGVDRDTKGAEISKNENRRNARSSRRMHQRLSYRKSKLVKILREKGLLPQEDEELEKLFLKDPYKIRAKGIDEKLSLFEFGRALLHLNQRRGFLSNRKSSKSKKEDNIVNTNASALKAKIEQFSCRTLGEYLSKVDTAKERRRDRYTFRSMYEEEFEELWEKQKQFYPKILKEDLKKVVKDETIFFQRPIRWDRDTIRDCDLEPGEKVCPRSAWYARRFRILQDINNLEIYNTDGSSDKLSDERNEERRKVLLEELLNKKEVTFDALRKKFGMLESQTFNLEEGATDKKKAKLKGDELAAQMRSAKILGKKGWEKLSETQRIEINDLIIDDDIEDNELVKILIDKYGFSQTQAEETLDVSLPSKYSRFSKVALKKLLVEMKKGKHVHEAIQAVYGKPQAIPDKGETLDFLPAPDDLRNPIVNRGLFEVRKLVNAIIREYGKPKRINIEMAREIKGSKKERDEIRFKQNENKKRNEETRKTLIDDLKIPNPSRDDIIKYKLWIECNKVCPYTGKTISQNALFGQNPEFQIEHIIPYSLCLDDSYMNKTLCYVDENKNKSNETPYEYYAEKKPKQYEEILQRIRVLPYPKRRRFSQKEVKLDKFIERQLNDTRYISREVVKYLKKLGVIVKGARGQVTAELRHCWGLNNILDLSGEGLKNRDDHRHHAVDAAVTAVTRNEHLRELARTKFPKNSKEFQQPWPDFREELEERVKHINVSHRVKRKVSGALHEETSYGPTGKKDEKGQDMFVYRKKLEDLTVPMVEKIVDPVVREILKNHLIERGIDPEKDKKMRKEVWNEPLYMKTTKSKKKIPIKKVRISEVLGNAKGIRDKQGKIYRYVKPGSNHHIEIFEYTNKKGKVKRDGKVITMFDAIQRSQRGEPVVKRDYGDGGQFIRSLGINEMFLMDTGEGNTELYRVQKISQNGQIFFRPHTFGGDLKKQKAISKVPNQLKGHKVTVDVIGRIHMAND